MAPLSKRWASVTSPGRIGWPPPSRPAALALWWGARKGGRAESVGSRGASPSAKLKIYLLPNLLTAGNLFCGFLALTKIVEAEVGSADFAQAIRHAIFFIILACVFDLLDGRVARLGGHESPFGRPMEFCLDTAGGI